MTPGEGQRCPQCRKHLPPEQYAPSARGRPGQWCRPCRRAADRKRWSDPDRTRRPRRPRTTKPAEPDRVPAAFAGLDAAGLYEAAGACRAVAVLTRGAKLAKRWRQLAEDLEDAADQRSPPPAMFV